MLQYYCNFIIWNYFYALSNETFLIERAREDFYILQLSLRLLKRTSLKVFLSPTVTTDDNINNGRFAQETEQML